jgi:hypothetical protein
MVTLRLDPISFLQSTSAFMGRHLPQIEVWALNWTADDVLEAMQDRMRTVFDRPTRFTQNAFHVWRATKATRQAVVQERPSVGSRHYLKVQERGGRRPMTALESLIASRVVTDQILQAVIPARGARLDAFGNWSPGERNQALSEIGAQRDQAANSTEVSIARARRRGRAHYFVPTNGGLRPGIWKRVGDQAPVKVATFAQTAPSYSPRLGFEGVVERVYRDRLETNLRRAFARAVQTMRP